MPLGQHAMSLHIVHKLLFLVDTKISFSSKESRGRACFNALGHCFVLASARGVLLPHSTELCCSQSSNFLETHWEMLLPLGLDGSFRNKGLAVRVVPVSIQCSLTLAFHHGLFTTHFSDCCFRISAACPCLSWS
jgi:hypothetical protein